MKKKQDKPSVNPATQRDLKLFGSLFARALLVVAAFLVVAEFAVFRYGDTEIDSITLFPAAFGFAAFVLIVIVGRLLRLIIMRREDYYDE